MEKERERDEEHGSAGAEEDGEAATPEINGRGRTSAVSTDKDLTTPFLGDNVAVRATEDEEVARAEEEGETIAVASEGKPGTLVAKAVENVYMCLLVVIYFTVSPHTIVTVPPLDFTKRLHERA